MAEVLVLVEHAEGALKKVTAELITAARALGEPAAVVVGKPGTAEPLVDGLKSAGAAKIYVAESDDAENYLITPYVDVLAALAESASPAGVLLAASADGKEIAGRLAARIGSGLLVDVVEVKEGGKGIHSIFGGAYTVEAEAVGDAPVITLRPGAIEAEPADGAGEVVTVEVPAPAENATKITSRRACRRRRPSRVDRGDRRRVRWPRRRQCRQLQRRRGSRRLAGCRCGRIACRGGLRLLPGPVPGRSDR